jgi:hypothetical protein
MRNKEEELSHTIENRKDIITEFKNRIFKNDVFLSNIQIEKNYTKPNMVYIEYWETEKFILLCTAKAGSSIISHIMDENKLNIIPMKTLTTKITEYYNDFFNIETEYIENEIDKDCLEYYKALNGKSKKDIILVTRNPIYKWMSGVVEDLNQSLNKTPFIKNLVQYEKSDDAWVNQLNLYKELLPYHIQNMWEDSSSIARQHSQLYNENFFYFLTVNNKIDLKKLHIIDIDNENHNLIEIIKAYYPEIKWGNKFSTHRLNHEFLFKNLHSYLSEKNISEPIINLIKKEISNDYKWYKILLKIYKNNLWVKK